jgi:hypothetical protein
MGNMTRARYAVGGLGLIVALASVAPAEQPAPEQIYFEAVVSKGERVVAEPHALVTVGAEAKLSFGSKEDDKPRLRLQYQVDQPSATDFTATITALVDGKEVASKKLAFSRDQVASVTLEGGGYSWLVNVEQVTPELLKSRAKRKPGNTT